MGEPHQTPQTGAVAQLVERPSEKREVFGSTPKRATMKNIGLLFLIGDFITALFWAALMILIAVGLAMAVWFCFIGFLYGAM